MTVSTDIRSHSYLPGSAMVAEALGFAFMDASDLVVTDQTGAVQDEGTDYEILGDPRSGAAEIRTLRVYGSTAKLTINRVTALVQETLLEAQKPLPAVAIMTELDRGMMIDQELRSDIKNLSARALQVPVGETADVLPGASARAGHWLGFDAEGDVELLDAAGLSEALAPELIDRLPAYVKGDVGPSAMSVGRWDQFHTVTVPDGINLLIIEDSLGTAGGTASFRVRRDPEQVEFRARETAVMNAAVARGQTLGNAQGDLRAAQKYWRRQSANGVWFVECEAEPTSAQFGTPGDGSQSSTNVITGTDVTDNLQQFFNYLLYVRRCNGRISPGLHATGALHFGWGEDFVGGYLQGGGVAYAGSGGFAGTALLQKDWTRPLINIAGGRLVTVRDLALKGPYGKWLADNLLGLRANAPGALADEVDANWHATYMAPSQDNRYNPHTLLTVDAYSGARPTPAAYAANAAYSYGDAVYTGGNVYKCEVAGTSGAASAPAGTGTVLINDGSAQWRWLGAYDAAKPWQWVSYPDIDFTGNRWIAGTGQYNRNNYTSGVPMVRVGFEGAVVPVAIKPCNNALQGDFVRFSRCSFSSFRVAISEGNHQSRNVTTDGCDFGWGHTAYTNQRHGSRSGAGQLLSLNCSYGAAMYIFDLSLSYGGCATFINAYCEAQAMLGVVSSANSGDTGLTFINPRFNFACNPARGRLGRILSNRIGANYVDLTESTYPRQIVFDGGVLSFDGALGLWSSGVIMRGTLIYDYQTGPTALAPNHPLGWMLNATSGGLFLSGLDYTQADQNIRFPLRNCDTGSPTYHQSATRRGYALGGRAYTIPFAVPSVRAASSPAAEELPVPWGTAMILAKSGLTVTQGPGDNEISVVWAGANSSNSADLQGFAPGAAVMDTGSMACGWIRSFDDGTDTAIIRFLDNYKTVGGVNSWFRNPVTSGGNLIFRRSGVYTPDNPVFFDCTDGSGNATNMGNSARVGTALTTDMANGDYVVTDSGTNALFGTTHTATVGTITNGSPGSAVFSNNVATGMGANRRRLAFLRRPRPANV